MIYGIGFGNSKARRPIEEFTLDPADSTKKATTDLESTIALKSCL